MVIKIVDRVNDDEFIEEAWQFYVEAFQDLNALAVQRHLMYRSEFDEVMRDHRIQKYLSLDDDGTMCGFSTYSNDLDAMPLIAPEYFARRWPDLYAQRKIWYCGFVAVLPRGSKGRANNTFAALVEAMYLVAATQNGIIGLDFCQYNDEVKHMSRAVRLMLHRFSGGVQAERMDSQSFWLYQFPNAA
jgi:hypothetical protein